MIPTYNCAAYLRATLESVLAQDPGSEVMQIEVVDDHSTMDDPRAVVQELGKGRVGFYQQPHNVGQIWNFETCLTRSKGYLVHLLHGDDLVRPGFYNKIHELFLTSDQIGAAFCRHIFADDQGQWHTISPLEQSCSGILSDALCRLTVEQRIQTPSIVVRRSVYEKLGAFDTRLTWCEDWEMWVRIAANYSIAYEVEPLAVYRMHSASNTGRKLRSGENIRDVRRAIDIMQEYIPQECASKIKNIALTNYAGYALRSADELAVSGDPVGARNQIVEALRCSRSPLIIVRATFLLLSVLRRYLITAVAK